ncbi:intermembrane lipid transfer protein VPS13A-like isoform X2 [Antedon mediterranea]|uniref:intermembrane lipid transfer protein VPS13A-like isoform X2 n=1 Tax=Antedon mediterranea TaxID=105859 RepID=UPI003AF6CFD2
MVFESLVVDLLNRFLGPYVENLNKNSLKLGIWSGDAVLENLVIKDGALDELELPFQIKAGTLEKLTLKIPWKNLYTSQVVAKIDGLYLLIVPKQGSYDAEKDKKSQRDAKQKALEKVEQAKEQENKPQEPDNKSDTFAEKLATQIIKNLQVEVQNIHIRYEDTITNPQAPFSAGVSLHNLSFETTNEDWKACILDQAVKMVYKLVKLDCLALYLNSNTRLFGSMSKDQCLMSLKSSIASPGHVDPDFQYVIEPISSEAQLKINPKPGSDLSTPKAWMNLVVMSIDLTLRQQQYHNLIQLLDSFERMVRNEPYRKYRPRAICHGHTKLWWKYAQTSILEENVRRRHKMWSWDHIKKHRDLCRGYKEVYGKKLATSKPSKELLANLQSYEDALDVFNLTLCRQQAELQYRRKKKKKEKEKKNAGWFGGFFGGGKKEKEDDSLELNEVAERVQNAMTSDDKAKLYEAIGYTEEIPVSEFPKEYVGILLNFHLIQTSVKLVDNTGNSDSNVLGVEISDLKAGISQRPAADAIRLDAKLNTFNVFGTSIGCEQHQMVESQNLEADGKVDLLEVEFETNPLDGLVDQRVKVLARPLKIVYDANTINQIVKFFEPPKDVHLDELSAAAASTIDEFTEQSATSLQYMADTKTILDVTVDLRPSYIIIPENGVYSEKGKVLVADLGHFRMTTEHEEKYDARRTENESLEELMKKSYDRFNMDLKSVQIILANEGEDWEAARKKTHSPLHLLQPLNVGIALHKCLVDDNRMPKVRILGELPSLDIDFSDKKLKDLISLATSIPLPETKAPDKESMSKAAFRPSATAIPMPILPEKGLNYIMNLLDDDDYDSEQDGYFTPCGGDHNLSEKSDGLVEKLTTTRDVVMFDSKKFNITKPTVVEDADDDEDEFLSAEEGDEEVVGQKQKLKREQSLGYQPRSNLELDFEVKRITLNMCQNNGTVDVPLLAVNIISLGAKVQLRPWQVTLDARLGSVSVQHMQMKALDGNDLFLVKTPLQDTTGERLMHLNYQKIEKDNPDFHTLYESTEQNIQVDVAGLTLTAHAEAILNIVAFSEQIVAMLDESKKEEEKALGEGYSSDSEKKPVRRRQTRPLPSKVIDVQLMAKLGVISIEACTCNAALACVDVKGVEAGVTIQKHQTIVSASLKDVTVTDPSPNTIYPKILSIVESSEVFKLGVVVHNSATVGQHYTDMSAVDLSLALSVGRIQAVFVNKFIMDLLQFVNRFAAAKKAAIEASESAAASAAKTMQEMQEAAMRAMLDVQIKAPVVIIPRSSTAKMAIYADLGELFVKNSFTIAAGSEELTVPAVVDTMDIVLNNVKLSRAFIEDGEVKSESLMLEPANMQLQVQRNLAAAYFTKLPAIAVNGKLQAVDMHIGPDDIALAFGVLNENLNEGQTIPDEVTQLEDEDKDKQKQDKDRDSEGGDQKQVSSQLSLNFTIESVGVSMYQKSADLTTCKGVQTATEGLGRLTVHGLEVEADMLTDSSLTAHMHLVNCVLDDIRPERVDGVTRMFGRQAKSDEESQMMVVKVDQRSNGSVIIVVGFNDVQTCVCVEFLMTVSQIFLKGLEDGQSAESKKKKLENVADNNKSAAPTTLDLSLHLKVENPEIILVADSSRKDTNCLVMRSFGDMRLRMNADLMSINGGFSQVSINACPYLVENRKGKLRSVLIPCNMGFQLQAPTGKAQHINVSFQEVQVNISPETVSILAAAAQGLTPPQVDEEQSDDVSKDLWNVAKVKDQNFWFLREDIESDVDDLPLKAPSDVLLLSDQSRGEELIFTVDMFAMKIETLCGSKMVPMLSAEAKVDAFVKDWSTRMKMESTITLMVSSYNEKTACWDPLLEPLEKANGGHRPWNLNISMIKNDDISDTSSSTGTSTTTSSEEESVELAPPLLSITVSSVDTMELTVTKSCLNMLMKLSEIFSEALEKGHSEIQKKTKEAACTITNSIGVSIYITPGKYFEIPDYAKDGRVRLQPGENLTLDVSQQMSMKSPTRMHSINRSAREQDQQTIDFQVEGFKEVRSVVLSRVGHILYNLDPTTKQKADMLLSVALEIEAQMDNRFIVIRSPLQMFNHFSIPIEVYINENNSKRKIGVVEPGKRFPVPLYVAHTQDLFVKPEGEYKLCTKAIAWKELIALKKQGKKYVSYSCDWKEEGFTPFCFNAITEMDKLRYVKGSSIQSPKYIIHLHPPVMLRNLLPYPIYFTLAGTDKEVCVEKAGQASLLHVVMGKTMLWMTIKDYMNMDWQGEMTMRETLKTPLSQWGFRGARQGQDNVWLEVGVWADYSSGYLDMAIYSPYWLVNKTEQTLRYRLPLLMKGSGSEVIEHAADTKEPILFSYPSKKSTPGKNKITMQICDSEWSDKFSLDTVGSSGFITCSGKGQNYNIGVKNQFSNFGLTKIIVFTPEYLLVNHSEHDIVCRESGGSDHLQYDVPTGQCIPFWPVDHTNQRTLVVKLKGQKQFSEPFLFTDPHTTVLKMEEVGGITAETQLTETAKVVAIHGFKQGNFTVKLVNTTDYDVKYNQQGVNDESSLGPNECILYTWQVPTKDRQLVLKVADKTLKNDLVKDGIGEIKITTNKKAKLYWVSFLDGRQRVLLFTEDIVIATKAQQAGELEQVSLELNLSLEGVGLSMVNNYTRTEVAYIGITSSGIIWQAKQRRRFRDLAGGQVQQIEAEYQKYEAEQQLDKNAPPAIYKAGNMEMDFENLVMYNPKRHHIKRTHHPGVWAQVRTSPHQFQFHLKTHRIQMDNQTKTPIFSTVLAPIPPPKSVATENALKPMIEMSLLMGYAEHSNVQQIKIFQVLIQEMHVKLDQGFLSNFIHYLQPDTEIEGKEVELLEDDIEVVTSPLIKAEAVQAALSMDRNYYDNFHLSPLKIHVSFSLADTGAEAAADESGFQTRKKPGMKLGKNAVNLLLQSVGVTLTNVDDVVFRLGYFERRCKFYSQPQLTLELTKHYSNQAVKQLYVLVLGLDVIGNPFGFVQGMGAGIKDLFYEPYQGAVQGPEEFAEGVALGMRSLFGHAVGGAAGAVSRITGTLGKGLAALTMDDDYKRKRQQAINRQPKTLQEGFARGGKGLVMGFVEGVSGVVTKPVQGVKKEGAKGFFKGMGKGLAGIVAKPTGGVVDFASSTFEGIRRATEVSTEVKKLRPARFLHPDNVVRPYVLYEATGNALLQEIDKGKFALTDDYVDHLQVMKDCVIVLTDRRVIYLVKQDVLGGWNVAWQHPWKELKEPPVLTDKGIQVIPKEQEQPVKRGPLGRPLKIANLMKGKGPQGKVVLIADKDRERGRRFAAKMQETYAKALKIIQ